MKSVLPIVTIAALAVLGTSCGGGSGPAMEAAPPAALPPEPPPQVSLAGGWSGTATDSNERTQTTLSVTMITWTLTQTGASVSGTVTTQSPDTPGATCNSCHRNKTGTLSGTIEGTKLAWTISFPGGGEGDPTPECTATLTGTASTGTSGSLSGEYTGTDSCEGEFVDGSLAMTRQPQSSAAVRNGAARIPGAPGSFPAHLRSPHAR